MPRAQTKLGPTPGRGFARAFPNSAWKTHAWKPVDLLPCRRSNDLQNKPTNEVSGVCSSATAARKRRLRKRYPEPKSGTIGWEGPRRRRRRQPAAMEPSVIARLIKRAVGETESTNAARLDGFFPQVGRNPQTLVIQMPLRAQTALRALPLTYLNCS